jgi:galactose mutarotase-like enzyme
MFPWVNRIEENPFLPVESEHFDGNGIPLHGLYVNDQREITVSPSENTVTVELIAQKVVEGVPKFRELYTLSKGSLRVEIFVEHSENVALPVCFGYHPYLQIDNEDLKDLKLTTDISV